MVRVKKVNDLDKYSFRTVSRSEEYAMLNDGFLDVFEMSNVDTILDFAQKYFSGVTEKCTKWYIHTKNDSILACQNDLLLCKLTDEDYRLLQGTKLNKHIVDNEGKRSEDKSRPHLLEIRLLSQIRELEEFLHR